MRGYQWALDDIKAKGRQARSVINMSLGKLSNLLD